MNITTLRKPCEHGRYEVHQFLITDFEWDLCTGWSEPSTADLIEELERRGFVGRFAGYKAP